MSTQRDEPTNAPSSRRRLSGDERRALLMDAALAVFAERGYEGASIGQIARAAGVSKALIYEHFPSKRDLHLELLRRHGRELEARLQRALAEHDSPEAATRSAIDAFLQFVAEHRDAWRILVAEVHEPAMREEVARLSERIAGLVAARIAASYGGDPARPTHGDELVARMFVGGIEALGKWWTRHPEAPRERLTEIAFDLYWEGAASLMERARSRSRARPPRRRGRRGAGGAGDADTPATGHHS